MKAIQLLIAAIVLVIAPAESLAFDASQARQQEQSLTAERKKEAAQTFASAFDALKENNFESAEILFKRGLEINPADYRAHLLLAQIYKVRGNMEGCGQEYEAVMALAPRSSKESADAEAGLKRIFWSTLPAKRRIGQWWKAKLRTVDKEEVFTHEVMEVMENGSYLVRRTSQSTSQVTFIRYKKSHNVYETKDDAAHVKYSPEQTFAKYPLAIGKKWPAHFTAEVTRGDNGVTYQETMAEAVVSDGGSIDTAKGKVNVVNISINGTRKYTSNNSISQYRNVLTYDPTRGLIMKENLDISLPDLRSYSEQYEVIDWGGFD